MPLKTKRRAIAFLGSPITETALLYLHCLSFRRAGGEETDRREPIMY